jgi:predicted nucleic acid-binding protein
LSIQVLDASAAVEVLVRSARGRWVRSRLDWPAGIWVPEHFFAEVSGTIRGFEQQGSFDAPRSAVMLTQLAQLPLRRVGVRPLLDEAWTLRHNLRVADAIYVVLARHLGAELVTCDSRLANAPGTNVPMVIAPGP